VARTHTARHLPSDRPPTPGAHPPARQTPARRGGGHGGTPARLPGRPAAVWPAPS